MLVKLFCSFMLFFSFFTIFESSTPVGFNRFDPLFPKQWYLHNGGYGGYDMSVTYVWALGFTGRGVVVSVLDDGLDWTHPDLIKNYDPSASIDLVQNDRDPRPVHPHETSIERAHDFSHGTECAGIIAMERKNQWCGVGIAYNVKLGGIRMIGVRDGRLIDNVENRAFSFNNQYIDIYSLSWSPVSDGIQYDGPGPLAVKAITESITNGRGGKGNIFVNSAGNGGLYNNNCASNGYANLISMITISSTTFKNKKPFYTEECAGILATTYSSANREQPAVVTTTLNHSCTVKFGATSASAAMASGIIALALEANPKLTWRDVQHLLVITSDPAPLYLLDNTQWLRNGARRYGRAIISSTFGYGLIDATRLVKVAQNWKRTLAPQKFCNYSNDGQFELRGDISNEFIFEPNLHCNNEKKIMRVEHVVLYVNSLEFTERGALKIILTSPMGTSSTLLPPRPRDKKKYDNAYISWNFLSVQFWGEFASGKWSLKFENVGNINNEGMLNKFSVVIYGIGIPELRPEPSTSVQTSTKSVKNLDNEVLRGHKELKY